LFREFFFNLAQHHPRWNFIFFYEPAQAELILRGIVMTIELAVASIVFSVLIGLVGAFLQTSRLMVLRYLTHGYIQLFRNTPPMVQLLFFYFALGSLTPTYSPDGWMQVPIISSVGWAIISLSFFAGSFNVEIFRAGLEAVPYSTREAAWSLGMTGLQTYRYVTLPLAFRASLPALNNNLINLVKTTTQAMVIAVPELFYQLVQIMSDHISAQYPAFVLMFAVYVGLVSVLAAAMRHWEKASRIPGYGN
jgi:polar amino acid transport system permease protein